MNRLNLMIAGVFFFNVAWADDTNMSPPKGSQDIARRVGQLESESKHLIEKVDFLEKKLSEANKEIGTVLSKQMPGSVVAFATKNCPNGWREYDQAYGRFIRGIDKSNKNIDPDGMREPGNPQQDAIKEHTHNVPSVSVQMSGAGSGPHSPWVLDAETKSKYLRQSRRLVNVNRSKRVKICAT